MLRLLAISSLFLLACEGEVPEPEPEELIADIQIGVGLSGSEGFAPALDGDDAELGRGAQGGFHVWTAPRFRGAEGTLYLDRKARRVEDDKLVLRAARLVIDVPPDAMESWWHEEQAIPSFMCPTPIGVQAYDTEIRFEFELRNEDEELLATDSLVLVPRCPVGEGEDFCRDVCGG